MPKPVQQIPQGNQWSPAVREPHVKIDEKTVEPGAANPAKLLAENPTLMHQRERRVPTGTLPNAGPEKVATNSKLKIVVGDRLLGDRGLTDLVMIVL